MDRAIAECGVLTPARARSRCTIPETGGIAHGHLSRAERRSRDLGRQPRDGAARALGADDPVGLHNVALTGTDCIMWGNDYPHDEGTFPYSRCVIEGMRQLVDPEGFRKIMAPRASTSSISISSQPSGSQPSDRRRRIRQRSGRSRSDSCQSGKCPEVIRSFTARASASRASEKPCDRRVASSVGRRGTPRCCT